MFLPRDSKIFDSMVSLSSLVEKSAHAFQGIARDFKKLKAGTRQLQEIEGDADGYLRKIGDVIEKIFILPLDREDIKELIERFDDVIDNLEEIVILLNIYKITKTNETLKGFAKLIVNAAEDIHGGMLKIAEHKFDLKEIYQNLHEHEEKGDKLHREVLAKMMGEEGSNLSSRQLFIILKWKEIFLTLENTLDKCEDIAVLYEKLSIKYR